MLRIDFTGTLNICTNWPTFKPLNPQPSSPYIFTPTGEKVIFRSSN